MRPGFLLLCMIAGKAEPFRDLITPSLKGDLPQTLYIQQFDMATAKL